MKACLKKPCFWALLAVLATTGGCWIWLVNTFGGPICIGFGHHDVEQRYERIRTVQYPAPPLWSVEGRHMVFNDDFRMYAVTTYPLAIKPFRSQQDALSGQEYAFEYAASLSQQGVIALTEYGYTMHCAPDFEIEVVSIDGSDAQTLSPGSHWNFFHPVWSPNGEHIAYLSPASVVADEPATGPYEIGVGLQRRTFTFLQTTDKNGANVRAYVSDVVAQNHPPVWSPSGEKIAFIGDEVTPNSPRTPYIAIADFEDSSVLKLVNTASLPGWSSDGERIAFVRHRNGVSIIYTIGVDGTDFQEVRSFPDTLPDLSQGAGMTYPLGGRDRLPRGHVSWSMDGSEIRLHQSPFVVVGADGSNLRIMRGRPDALASWSPDESQIAVYLPGYAVRLFTMDPDGSNKRALVWFTANSDGADQRAEHGELAAARTATPLPDEFAGFVWTTVPQ